MIDYASAVLLLDVTWAGLVFRFASELVEVDGYLYDGGIAISYTDAAGLLSDAPEDSIDLGELVFPVDVALWHAQGRPLLGSEATLRVWSPGLALDRARILSRGTVGAVEYGEAGQPARVAFDPPSLVETANIVDPEREVNNTTWPNLAEAARGEPYPVVFGKPGLGSGALLEDRGGSRALLVDTTGNGKWLICGERVAASSVVLVDVTAGNSETIPVTYDTDGAGAVVAVLAGTGTTVTPTDGNVYRVDWSDSDGGVIAPGKTTAALGAGSQALWLLERSSVAWDRGKWSSAEPILNRYRFSWYADQGRPADVLRGDLAQLLPITVRSGAMGLAPVIWRWRSGDAVAALEHGRNCYRAGAVSVDLSRVANEHTIAYAPRDSDGDMTARRTLTGRDVASTGDLWRDLACAVSASWYGNRAAEALEAPQVYEDGTATQILADRAVFALPHERIEVEADPELGRLEPGDVVTYTDDGLHKVNAFALVESVAVDGPRVAIGLVMVPQPARDLLGG